MGRNRDQTRSSGQRVMHSLPVSHRLRYHACRLVPAAFGLLRSPIAPSPLPRARLLCGGYSLIELLIAMVAGAVVLSVTIQSFSHLQHRFLGQQAAIARHQDLRIGLAVMTSELRLAGVGREILGALLRKAEPSEIAFWANLRGLTASLTREASALDLELGVTHGSAWPKGKRVVVCGIDRCAQSRLARSGRSKVLNLTHALEQTFPAGSQVMVVNEVRYYLSKVQQGRPSLMRMVDKGASSLIGDVEWFQLTYLDREGRPTRDSARVTRVLVEIAVGEGGRVIRHEVAFRA